MVSQQITFLVWRAACSGQPRPLTWPPASPAQPQTPSQCQPWPAGQSPPVSSGLPLPLPWGGGWSSVSGPGRSGWPGPAGLARPAWPGRPDGQDFQRSWPALPPELPESWRPGRSKSAVPQRRHWARPPEPAGSPPDRFQLPVLHKTRQWVGLPRKNCLLS